MSGTEFMTAGLCAQADPDAFHPEQGAPVAPAVAICQRCPVQAQCLEYALAHDERFGIWGGTTARQRQDLRRRQHRPSRVQQHRDDQRATARRMRARGCGKTEIARALRISGATLNRYLTH